MKKETNMGRGRLLVVWALAVVWLCACESKPAAERPSGIKNMAPPPVSETLQDGLDVEPNDTFLQAIDVTMTGDGIQWSGTLGVGDVDVWRVKAKAGTVADIVVTPTGSVDIIADYAPTDTESERRVYDLGARGASELLHHIRLTPAGGYLTIRARSNGKDASSQPEGYRVSMTRVMSEDGSGVIAGEPDDSPENALVLTTPGAVEAALYPSGDVDFYRMAVSQPVSVEFDLPEGACEVSVVRGEEVLWQKISRKAQKITSDAIEAGPNVFVRVRSLEAVETPLPYRMEVLMVNDAGAEREPNDSPAQAQPLVGEWANRTFSLASPQDVDVFRLAVTPEFVARLHLVSDAQNAAGLRLEVIDEQGAPRPDVTGDSLHACDVRALASGSILLRVSGGPSLTYPVAYRLKGDTERAYAVETEPNSTPEQAMPLEIDRQVLGHIFPAGDIDYYRIDVAAAGVTEGVAGKLRLDIEGGYVVPLVLKLQDSGGYEVSQARSAQASRPIHMEFDAPAGGYVLSVAAGGGGGDRCAKPYALRATFEPSQAAKPQGQAEAPADDIHAILEAAGVETQKTGVPSPKPAPAVQAVPSELAPEPDQPLPPGIPPDDGRGDLIEDEDAF